MIEINKIVIFDTNIYRGINSDDLNKIILKERDKGITPHLSILVAIELLAHQIQNEKDNKKKITRKALLKAINHCETNSENIKIAPHSDWLLAQIYDNKYNPDIKHKKLYDLIGHFLFDIKNNNCKSLDSEIGQENIKSIVDFHNDRKFWYVEELKSFILEAVNNGVAKNLTISDSLKSMQNDLRNSDAYVGILAKNIVLRALKELGKITTKEIKDLDINNIPNEYAEIIIEYFMPHIYLMKNAICKSIDRIKNRRINNVSDIEFSELEANDYLDFHLSIHITDYKFHSLFITNEKQFKTASGGKFKNHIMNLNKYKNYLGVV